MRADPLRFAALVAYLASWVAFAIGAILSGIPKIKATNPDPPDLSWPVITGTALQLGAAMLLTFTLSPGKLHPSRTEQQAALFLAPLGALLFLATVHKGFQAKDPKTLITDGIYRHFRHPMYLAFGAMLLATGALASSGAKLALATAIYLAGTELRIHHEESQFGERYQAYRQSTRWRYLPGLR